MSELAEALLRGSSSLSAAERETIATFVCARDSCGFCRDSRGAAARLLGDETGLVELVRADGESDRWVAPIDRKMQALIAIASKVQQDARTVSPADVELARTAGADDKAIHDTVLLAAAFCMYDRYVDGLTNWVTTEPDGPRLFDRERAAEGYQESTEEMYRRLW